MTRDPRSRDHKYISTESYARNISLRKIYVTKATQILDNHFIITGILEMHCSVTNSTG